MDWYGVAAIVLAVLAVVSVARWQKFKKLTKEFGEALVATSKMLEDDKATPDELKDCAKEWAEAIAAAKEFLGK